VEYDTKTTDASLSIERRDAIASYFLDRRFRILYMVPFAREPLEDASIFRLYSQGLLDTAKLHVIAAKLPADVRELGENWETIYRFREARLIEHTIFPIYLDSFLDGAGLFADTPFRVVLSNPDTAEVIDELLSHSPHRWIHISTAEPKNDRVSAVELTRASFRELLRKRYLSPDGNGEASAVMTTFDQVTKSEMSDNEEDLLYQPRGHNITAVNEIATCCFGVNSQKPLELASMDREEYLQAVVCSVEEVTRRRMQLKSTEPIGSVPYQIVIAVPSILEYYYSNRFTKNNDFRRKDPTLHRFIIEVTRQKSYFYMFHDENVRTFVRNEAQFLMAVNTEELLAFSAALAVFAARTLSPVLRLEPIVNSVRPLLAKVAQLSRGNHPRRKFKVNAAAREAMDYMRGSIAPKYLGLLSEPEPAGGAGVKLVADLPLEWLPVNRLPLMMAYETSRTTTTPGNVNLEQLVVGRTRHLDVSTFSDVLIIRSFKKADPIRSMLEVAISRMKLGDGKLPVNVRVVDVESADEFVAAWNSFDGAILIFDGHGQADTAGGVGSIVVGGVPLSPWDLRERLHKNPPIVIMSACDTHSVDSGHATVGNAMLMLGATAVLARYSALFIARLLLRVAQFIPIATSSNLFRPLTWRAVVTGLQRMTFVTEIILSLEDEGFPLTDDQRSQIQFQANTEINGGNPRWYSNFVDRLATAYGDTNESVRDKISTWASLVDVLHYVQLGSPESIIIAKRAGGAT
jgi:hypothetical protein